MRVPKDEYKICRGCDYKECHISVSELGFGLGDVEQVSGGFSGDFIDLGEGLFACPVCGTVQYSKEEDNSRGYTSEDIPY